MNETSPVQKQDIDHLSYKLDVIVQLLEKLVEILREKQN